MRSIRLATVSVLLASAACAGAAEHRTGAMVWGSGIQGMLQIGGSSAELDLSLEDLFKVLDGSITLRHESRGEQRGWYGEFVYNDLKKTASGPSGERQANVQQTIYEFGLSMPIGEGWETYGGLRAEEMDNSIDYAAAPTVTAGADWVDVVLGVRWDTRSADRRWWARGDVAGGGSDGAFLFEFGGAWRFAEAWEASIAYRGLDTNFDEGIVKLDLTQSGLVIGVSREW